jgi:hypothetical protein
MESTHTTSTTTKRSPAVSALAIVGFIALILLGMLLAIYVVRFIPAALSGMGEAAVSLSRVFSPDDGQVEVIDQPATPSDPGVVVTIPIGPETPTEPAPAAPTTPAPSPVAYQPAAPAYVPPTYYGTQPPVIVPIQGQAQASGYGSPDLSVEIMEVGYVTRDGSASTFRESSRVPRGEQGAVKFRISNRGTNESGRYEYEVKVKNDDNRTDTATGRAPSLAAGQSVITYAFFDARTSGDADIDIEVDSDNDVRESNERNNTDSDDVSVRD